MNEALPVGWTSAPVSDVIEDFQPGFASGEKNVEGGVAHLRMNNIGLDGELVLDLLRTVPKKLAKPRHDLSPGDVLVCTTNSGALVGKCAYFDLPGRYAFSNHLTRLRPKRDVVDGRFLRWNLWLHWKRGLFNDKCKHWVNQSTLPKDALLENEVVVPPLGEQRRIVAKLAALLGKVDASQQRLAKIPVLLKRFRQSVLAAACSGRLTADWREENPQELPPLPVASNKRPLPAIAEEELLFEAPATWRWCRLGSLATFINGDRGKNYPNKNEYVPVGVPFINTGHIEPDGSLSSESMHHLTREKFESLRSGKIRKGDLVYCLRGATLGKTAFVEPYEEGAIASSLVIVRPAESADRKFLYYFLTSPSGKELVDRFDNGSAQPNLSADSVKNYVISLPPLPEQHEIVRRVEGLFALADQLEERLTKARGQVEKLTPSLLARAFAGQLVPQNPTDESAEKLLERIRRNGERKP